jgi:hypothetical protein
MKKAGIIFMISLFSFVNSYAQWQQNGNDIYFVNGNVGIGESSPNTSLEVLGLINQEDVIKFKNNYTATLSGFAAGNESYYNCSFIGNRSRGSLQMPASLYEGDRITGLFARPFIAGEYRRTAAIHFYVGRDPSYTSFPTNIRFETTGTDEIERKERMRIDENGNIGIGTKTPNAKLEIADGDIYISDITQGIIMRSPDGSCWKGTVDNYGSLNFVRINCPGATIVSAKTPPDKTEIGIYPNPSNGRVEIKLHKNTRCTLQLSDINGRQLLQKEFIRSTQIDLTPFAKGVYFLNISSEDGIKTNRKLVKN